MFLTRSPEPEPRKGLRLLFMPALWIGFVCSVLLAVYIGHWERNALHTELRELANDRAQVLHSSMRSSTEVLYSLASLYTATGNMNPGHFRAFARDAVIRHPELRAVEWIPRVPEPERHTYEQFQRQSGHANFSFTEIGEDGLLARAAYRPEYFPVYFVEPMMGNLAAHGFDLGANKERLLALEQARDTGLPAVTAPIRLAQETETQQGFLMFYPVYDNPDVVTISQRRTALRGFALAVFRADDLVANALRDLTERGISIAIFDTEEPARPLSRQLASPVGVANPDWLPWAKELPRWSTTINVAGRSWRLEFEPTAQFSAHRRSGQSIAALAVGLVLTFLLVAYLASAARRTREINTANEALQREVGERERAVEAAQAANRAKSDFLANMSHEIRTPLNAVLGYAQLLRRDNRLDYSQRESVNAIILSGNHLLSQINEVLDFSKIETGRMELQLSDVYLNELLRELELMFRPRCQDKGLQLRVQPLGGEQQTAVVTDGCKLRQILINLLGNAVRFTRKGEVILGCCIIPDGRYRFDVIDTGPGISSLDRQRIFEPFFQGHSHNQSGGTGLGLAIARRQACLLGGELEVATEEGEGSRFTLLLPLVPAIAASENPARAAIRWQLSPGMRLRVLIIDDVTANREILHHLLADAGCETAQARDHQTAVSQCRASLYNVIFLDIRMPDGSGLDLLVQLRQLQPQVPVIAYSALAFEQDRAQFLAAGCQAFVAKPLESEVVFATLEQLLGVVFTREWEQAARASADKDFMQVALPAELHQRLLTAAELHSTTALKAGLEDLCALGGDALALAETIRQQMRAYNMDAIARLLSQLEPYHAVA
jgi:signal transduction histidine kinase/DNA-binding response OmpR family regulator